MDDLAWFVRSRIRSRRSRERRDFQEIYLGDPRRTKPEKLKTVLRHPVRKKR